MYEGLDSHLGVAFIYSPCHTRVRTGRDGKPTTTQQDYITACANSGPPPRSAGRCCTPPPAAAACCGHGGGRVCNQPFNDFHLSHPASASYGVHERRARFRFMPDFDFTSPAHGIFIGRVQNVFFGKARKHRLPIRVPIAYGKLWRFPSDALVRRRDAVSRTNDNTPVEDRRKESTLSQPQETVSISHREPRAQPREPGKVGWSGRRGPTVVVLGGGDTVREICLAGLKEGYYCDMGLAGRTCGLRAMSHRAPLDDR